MKSTILLLMIVALGACTATPNPIAQEVRDGVFVRDATIAWSVDDADENDENGSYAAGKEDLIARLEPAVEAAFRDSPSGSDPIILNIDIHDYNRVNNLTGNMLGGANGFAADVSLVRETDGATIGVYENVVGVRASGGGIIGAMVDAASNPDIVAIMVNSFVANLRRKFDNPN